MTQPAQPIKLHIGCGPNILPGWVNLDCAKLPGVDIVHDLNQLPLPFADGSVAEILAQDVFEHVNYIPLLKESLRLLVPGGELRIQVPHFTAVNNFDDPTHINMFSSKTFNYFSGNTYEGRYRGYYFDFQFSKVIKKRMTFNTGTFFKFNYPIAWLVNSHWKMMAYYEATGLARLFPAVNIQVTLQK